MIIAIEGIDQAGKATQALAAATHIRTKNIPTTVRSFPIYETAIGEAIKTGLNSWSRRDAETSQLLYIANRFEEMRDVETHARLAIDDILIFDRYKASSIAYGEAQGVDVKWLNEVQAPLPEADLTILLDIDPALATRRKPAGRDRYESDPELLAKARDSYLRQASEHGWTVIDGSKPIETVSAETVAAIDAALKRDAR